MGWQQRGGINGGFEAGRQLVHCKDSCSKYITDESHSTFADEAKLHGTMDREEDV